MDFIHRYSDSINDSRVVIIGPYPPPLGGISVHIERVMHKLQQQNNQVFHFHNEKPYKYPWLRFLPFKCITYVVYFFYFFFWILFRRPVYVMYHTMYSGPALTELYILMSIRLLTRCTIKIIEHNCRHMYMRSRWWKLLYNYVLSYTHVIFIGQLPYQSYRDNKMHVQRYTVEGAFLPPDRHTEQRILQNYSFELIQFIKTHWPVLLINGSHIKWWHNQDVYGFDHMIHAMADLKKEFSTIGLVIMIANMDDAQYFAQIQQWLDKYGIAKQVYINSGQHELWPLFKRVQLFVRPTVCDGASVSLQEALYFDTPVVASNVCPRPGGTVLYQQGDVNDLVQKISMALKEHYGAIDQQRDHMHTQQTG